MDTTVVVVDVQPACKAATQVIAPIRREIKRAIYDDNPIVIVEYAGGGETLPEILGDLEDDALCSKVIKTDDDGSSAVASRCKQDEFPTNRFLVLGVNTDGCVYETARGLSRCFPSSIIELMKDACASSSSSDPWERFGQRASEDNWHCYKIVSRK